MKYIIGGAKTGCNLHKVFLKNQVDSTFYYFDGEFGEGKQGGRPIEQLPVDKLDNNFIVTSERAFVYFKEQLENKIPSHYYLRDKENYKKIAKNLGVKTIPEYDLNNIKFPAFVKPKQSGEGVVPFKTKVVKNTSEFDKIKSFIEQCSVQKYFDRNNYEQIAIAGYFTGSTDSLISVKQLNYYPLGVSSYVTFSVDLLIEALKKKTTIFLNSLEFEGFIELEFKKNKSDNFFYLMDINPRPWGWFYYYVSAIQNLKDAVKSNTVPIIDLKKSWVNLPRLILSNLHGRFRNPPCVQIISKEICYEPYL